MSTDIGYIATGNGSRIPVSFANPLPVDTPLTLKSTATGVVTASAAYTSRNAVGGLLTFTGAARVAAQGGILQTVILRDKAGQSVSYDLFLFTTAPTHVTDKSAAALDATDLSTCIGVVAISTIALGAASTIGVFTAKTLGMAFKLPSGTTLYGLLVVTGTPTYASTSDVSVDLVILPD